MVRLAVLTAALMLSACSERIVRVPVEVKVPVPVKAKPPAELLEPIEAPVPSFIAPGAPQASSCLSPEGERKLKVLSLQLLTRVRAFTVWAETKEISNDE